LRHIWQKVIERTGLARLTAPGKIATPP